MNPMQRRVSLSVPSPKRFLAKAAAGVAAVLPAPISEAGAAGPHNTDPGSLSFILHELGLTARLGLAAHPELQ